jgi:predicted dehydrogenase
MSINKVRWGILGVAAINNRLLPSFARARNLELRGIASRSLDKARAAAKAAGIPKAYGTYDAMLDDPEIDIVYIPLPNHLHAEWTKKAADRGKHVMCEKPLAPTADEAADVVAHCRKRGVKLMDGFMWPHHPRTDMIDVRLQRGVIGPVRRVSSTFTFQLPRDPANIRLQPQTGGGSLLDVGCYPVYGIRWAFGREPERVWATARYEFGVDVELNGVLWFADGGIATFDCGFVHPMRQWLEIAGEHGTLTVPEMWVPRSDVAEFSIRDEREKTSGEGARADQMQCMLENFSRCVLEDRPVKPDPHEAVKTLRVLDALARSAREGAVVPLAA